MAHASLAIGTAFLCIVCFTFRDFLLRYFKVMKDYPAFEFSLDALTFESTGCTIFAFYYFVILGNTFDWDSL